MTEAEYSKSIQTGYLQLGLWQKILYYKIVCVLFAMPVIVIISNVIDYFQASVNFQKQEMYVFIIPLIIGGIAYWIQKEMLKFEILTSNINKEHLAIYIEQLFNEKNWTLVYNNDHILIALAIKRIFLALADS